MITVGVITISDKGSRGEREDLSVEEIRKLIPLLPGTIVAYIVIPDEKQLISETLVQLADQKQVDFIVTSGGTGLSPRDVTPEATRQVIEKEIPGMAEAMRQASSKKTPFGILSRSVVGTRGATLIVNLPGSPKGVRENLSALLPVIPHAIDKLKGDTSDCGSL